MTNLQVLVASSTCMCRLSLHHHARARSGCMINMQVKVPYHSRAGWARATHQGMCVHEAQQRTYIRERATAAQASAHKSALHYCNTSYIHCKGRFSLRGNLMGRQHSACR